MPDEHPIKKRIYIAGPYCPLGTTLHDAPRVANHNVQRAIEVFHLLRSMGYMPFVPHLSHYLHIEGPEDYEGYWLDYDMTILERWAEAIFMLEGWENSAGSKMEHDKAIDLGIQIIYENGHKNVRR